MTCHYVRDVFDEEQYPVVEHLHGRALCLQMRFHCNNMSTFRANTVGV